MSFHFRSPGCSMKRHRQHGNGWLREFTNVWLVKWFDFCNWLKYIFLCCFILLEPLSRLWGSRRFCGAAGRTWAGPLQDDAFGWPLLFVSWPWWDVSLMIIYEPVKIPFIKFNTPSNRTPQIFYTWEGKFHPKNLHFAPWANVRIFIFEHMYGIGKTLAKSLTLGEEPLKRDGCVFKVGPKKTMKMTIFVFCALSTFLKVPAFIL